MVLAEGLKGRDGGFDHGNVIGAQDLLKDLEHIRRNEREILGRFLNQSS
jgi:hypothetical protein